MWPAVLIFATSVAVHYLWKSKLKAVVVIIAAGVAGWAIY